MATRRCGSPSPEITSSCVWGSWPPCRVGSSSNRRASAVDSFSYRYRTIVPEDCVGDIEEEPHRDNLRDIGRRYVDVSDLATVLAYFEDWRKSNAA